MPLLDDPNESFSHDADIVQTDIVVFATSDQNVVTNSGVLWATGATANTIFFGQTSSAGSLTNTMTGYIRGGDSAIAVTGNNATINNAGEITGSKNGIGIGASSNVQVNNSFGGTIKGGDVGISFAVSSGEINNDGIVYGNTGVVLGAKLTNSGEVGGNLTGVVCAAGDTATIVNTNFGGIWSSGTGIKVDNGAAAITNDAGCLITGTQAAIATVDTPGSVLSSRVSLTNLGKIDGLIDCNATLGNVNDTVVNKGTISGYVFLGTGNDSFNGAGGASGAVFGEDGNDILISGSGKDYLAGGLDKDTLTGGLGADAFVFAEAIESAVGANRDVITDFRHKQRDKLDLHLIDANENLGGDQAFKFIGSHKFHDKAGEMRAVKQGKSVIVSGDIDGDGVADFQIQLNGLSDLVKGDFIL